MPTPASLNLKQRLASSLQTSSSSSSSPSSPLLPPSPSAPPKSPLKQNLQNLIASAGAAGGGLKGKLKALNFRGGGSSSSAGAGASTASSYGGGPNGNGGGAGRRRSSYGNVHHHAQGYPYGQQQQSAFQGSNASLSAGFLPPGKEGRGEDAIDEVMGRLIFQAGVDFE
jgi:hypothetical protein